MFTIFCPNHNLYHELYDGVHIILSVLYFILVVFCITNIVRLWSKIQRQLPWNRIFYPLLLAGCIIRCVFNFLQPFSMEKELYIPEQIDNILSFLPSFIFFTTYLLILFRWAEIYHLALPHHSSTQLSITTTPTTSSNSVTLRRIFFTLITIMYLSVVSLFIVDFTMYPLVVKPYSETSNVIEKVIGLYDASLYLLTSLGFVVYGVKIFHSFRNKNYYSHSGYQLSPARNIVIRRIVIITVLVVFSFSTRGCIAIWSVICMPGVSEMWWFDFAYYCSLEIVPLLLMLRILRFDGKNLQTNAETSPLITNR